MAATSWPWRATRSSCSTTGRRPCRSPRCRCSPSCPAPAAYPPRRQALRAARPRRRVRHRTEGVKGQQASTGGSSTPSRPAAGSTRSCASGPWPGRRSPRPEEAAASSSGRSRRGRVERAALRPRDGRRRPGPRRRPHHGAAPTGEPITVPDDLDAGAWLIAAVRQLDDAILRLRFNEPEMGTWVLHSAGTPTWCDRRGGAAPHADHWLVNEPRRTGRGRSSASTCRRGRSSPSSSRGSGCAGVLAELVLAADRSFMLDGPGPRATIAAGERSASPRRTTDGSRCPTG